jgi:transcriptional regulator of acetoin/glycerol metabolism
VEDLGLSSSRIEAPVVDYNGPTASPIKYGEIVPLNEYERRYILGVLEATNWRIKGARGAATLLGVPPSTLYGKIKKLGISSQRGWSDK